MMKKRVAVVVVAALAATKAYLSKEPSDKKAVLLFFSDYRFPAIMKNGIMFCGCL